MWDGIDRRKFPRAHYKCLIYITTKDSSKTISTHTENIGAGGICVLLSEDLGLFQGVNLEIQLSGQDPSERMRCNGTVVWVVKKHSLKQQTKLQYDTGIEFVDIREEDATRIDEIISKLLKEK